MKTIPVVRQALLSCAILAGTTTLAHAQARHSEYPFEATGEYSIAGPRHAVGPDTGAFLMKRPPSEGETTWNQEGRLRSDFGKIIASQLMGQDQKERVAIANKGPFPRSDKQWEDISPRQPQANTEQKPVPAVKQAPVVDIDLNQDKRLVQTPDLYGARAAVVFFDNGSFKPNNPDALRPLKISPNDQIILRSRTDSVGKYEANKRLAAKRADTVADMLALLHNVNQDQISKQILGEDSPVASNHTARGRSFNRTIIIYIR